MDTPAAEPAELRRSLAYIRRVNAVLGYHQAMLKHLRRFAARWEPRETISVLDVATGSGDLPRAVLRCAAWRDVDVRVTAVDLHATTLSVARQLTPRARYPESRLRFVRADALRLPFADGAFDYATTSMFLHHLTDDDAAAAVGEMARVARRGIVVADLLRHRRAYAWITLFTLASGAMVKHDARASVAQAFTEPEVLDLRDRAGVPWAKYHRHFGHRFVLAGEKGS
jgi:ubiquinone/menaquinone biosynthesis C-methylase UbiE